MTVDVFNPLDKQALAESIENKLLERPAISLSRANEVKGAGIYAIYYVGAFPPYEKVAKIPLDEEGKPPLYVGKAIPKGSRKGGMSADVVGSRSLRDRLSKHARVIDSAINLELKDFFFRHLVVDDVWIPLGENVLIENFKPLWNVVLDGFGNNKPGKRRQGQTRSSWDTLHPGRKWASLTADPVFSAEDVAERVRQALS